MNFPIDLEETRTPPSNSRFGGEGKAALSGESVPESCGGNSEKADRLAAAPGAKDQFLKQPPRIPLSIRQFVDLAESTPVENGTLLGNHWLFRGGWGAIIGPTGQGKTSIKMQMAALWSIGWPAFGIKPNGPLKIMMAQVENDENDLIEMASGILEGLSATDEERELMRENLLIVTPRTPKTSLFDKDGEITELMREWKPDLLILDSLYKWTPKGNAADSEGLFHTIDQTILPLCKELNCGMFASHHMGRAEVLRIANNENSTLSDLYAGAGGMFVADNARCTLLLVPEDDEPGHYILRGAKRKSRLGWKDSEEEKIYEKHLQWADGRIGWNEVDEVTAAKRKHRSETRKADEKLEKKREQVLWAIRHAGGGDGDQVEQDVVSGFAQGSGGPLPKGISDKPFRDTVKALRSSGIIGIESRPNQNNRKANFLWIRKP